MGCQQASVFEALLPRLYDKARRVLVAKCNCAAGRRQDPLLEVTKLAGRFRGVLNGYGN